MIKLNAAAITSEHFVLTLEPDVLALKPITRELLLPGGRALLEPEPREVHRRWWRDSADLLDVEPELERPGMNVTPALLSTAILLELPAAPRGTWRAPLDGHPVDKLLRLDGIHAVPALPQSGVDLVASAITYGQNDSASPAHLRVDPRAQHLGRRR